jgi:hypothetical protein
MLYALLLPALLLTGTLPDSWGNLALIEHIELAHTRWQPHIVGSWPAGWGNMTSLRWLDLSASTGYAALITGVCVQQNGDCERSGAAHAVCSRHLV